MLDVRMLALMLLSGTAVSQTGIVVYAVVVVVGNGQISPVICASGCSVSRVGVLGR
jgi:hypothetical protein